MFPSLRSHKNILNISCFFVSLINIRNKKMEPGTSHISTSLLSHLSHPATSLPSHLSQLATSLPSHLSDLATSLPSHLPYSLPSCLSQLTTFPTTNRSLQNNVLPLGRQGKHVWLILRQVTMKAGWWDAPGFKWSNQPHYPTTFPNLPPHYAHTPSPPSQLTTSSLFFLSLPAPALPLFLAHHPPNYE